MAPLLAVEDDRAGFGFADQLPKLPLRKAEFADDVPRVITWTECQREAAEVLEEVSLDFEDIKIFKIKEADKPHCTAKMQFRMLDTYPKRLFQPTLTTIRRCFIERKP